MKLWTAQISKSKKSPGVVIDISIKSGELTFAPTWNILNKYKNNQLTVEEYKFFYLRLMRDSWHRNKGRWLEVAHMPEVTIVCYCASGDFCHRLCLRDALEAVCKSENLDFEYMGEVD